MLWHKTGAADRVQQSLFNVIINPSSAEAFRVTAHRSEIPTDVISSWRSYKQSEGGWLKREAPSSRLSYPISLSVLLELSRLLLQAFTGDAKAVLEGLLYLENPRLRKKRSTRRALLDVVFVVAHDDWRPPRDHRRTTPAPLRFTGNAKVEKANRAGARKRRMQQGRRHNHSAATRAGPPGYNHVLPHRHVLQVRCVRAVLQA